MSSDASLARTASIIREMLSRSLKVGMTTSERSGTPSPVEHDPRGQRGEGQEQRHDGDQLAGLVGRAYEAKANRPGARGQIHSGEGVVHTGGGGGAAVNFGFPQRV